MKYTIIASLTARDHWNTIDTGKSWAEAWEIHQRLKAAHPEVTYHII